MRINKIVTNLWFDTQAFEAAKLYTSIFPNSEIGRKTYYGKERHVIDEINEGDIMTVEFTLNGQPFVALNGGPHYKFSEAISFIINCETQEELDYYWDKLSEGGEEKAQVCGWLKDRYGVSWQIVPTILSSLMSYPDKEKAERVTKAMLGMKKMNIAELQKAFEGK